MKVFKYHKLHKGDVLFSKDDVGDTAYIILEGRVAIYSNPVDQKFQKAIDIALGKYPQQNDNLQDQ